MTGTNDLFWKVLLEFKKQFSRSPAGLNLVSAIITQDGFEVFCNEVPVISPGHSAVVVCLDKHEIFTGDAAVFMVDDELFVDVLQSGKMNKEEIEFFCNFLPFCLMPKLAFKLKHAISVIHLAQSIDGRMATVNLDSKWISSSENLVYVHRMRALSDGIMIGAHTLQNDEPALTVRYVTGPNPAKIILGNSAVNFESVLESKDRIIHLVTQLQPNHGKIENVCLDEKSGFIHPFDILHELYNLGISSVYIEGGAYTISTFIREQAVDLVNFYISPVILGSGISIEFQGIDKIDEALSLHNCIYTPMGDGILIRGRLKKIMQ